ncbi:protein kinase [bacterium]|nr:protein kinase [bacterium]
MAGEWTAKARWAALRGDHAAAGDLYRLAGNLPRALEMYRKGRLYRAAGEVSVQLGDYAAASRDFELGGMLLEAAEQAMRAGDRDRAARLFIDAGQSRRAAQIHADAGRPGKAAPLYEHAGDYLRAARLFLDAREAGGASRCLDSLCKAGIAPQDTVEIQALAQRCAHLLLSLGDPDGAAKWYERSGRSSDAARAWERAGQPARAVKAYLAAGEAERAATVAEGQPPEKIEPLLAAQAYHAAGRWGEAAGLFLEAGRPAEAAQCLEALGCSAEAAWAHEAAGDLPAAAAAHERAGNLPEAAAMFRRAGAMREAARCFEAAGALQDAARCYLDGGRKLDAAKIYEQLGNIDEAVEILQSLSPEEPEERYQVGTMLGRLFELKGHDALAAEQYKRALATEPDPPHAVEALYLLAAALERAGRAREATHALRRLVSIDFNFADAAARLERLENRAGAAKATSGPQRPQRLPERYAVEGELSGRAPGAALLARDTVMERPVVLRRFGPDVVRNEKAADRILADARRVARLHHPAIAGVYEAGREGTGVYLVEEHVGGRSLREILRQDGPLDVPRAVQIFTRLAEALDYAHGLGLLARSLRPETIYVNPSGEAKMVDFGLALREADWGGPDASYRPPEVDAHERMDSSSDVFLLGVVAYEMLFGAPPPASEPDGKTPPPFPRDPQRPVPELLRRVISGCLVPDRSRRTGSAQKLLEDLHGTHLLPGALMANRYEILKEIGRGGMGTVFVAKDLVLDEKVALKVLAGALDENTEKRFIQEIRLARQINHPNVVRVHTFERWREMRFIVMEYIDGVDLRKWAASRGPIPLGQALDVVAGVAEGLAAAHRLGIVHRDVKPENVLVDGEGRPHLCDFGIARKGDVHLTREGLVMGSPAYMAPEQIRGQAADARADLYALGILAFFLIAGREPFASENVAEVLRQQLEVEPPALSSLRQGVPRGLEDLVARVLSKDPARRAPSVFDFLGELKVVRAGLRQITN